MTQTIAPAHPGWSADSYACRPDLTKLRAKHIHSVLESEKGELTSLEAGVLKSLREHEILAANLESESQAIRTLGGKLTRNSGIANQTMRTPAIIRLIENKDMAT